MLRTSDQLTRKNNKSMENTIEGVMLEKLEKVLTLVLFCYYTPEHSHDQLDPLDGFVHLRAHKHAHTNGRRVRLSRTTTSNESSKK